MPKAKVGNVYFYRLFEGEDLLEAMLKRVKEGQIKAGFFFAIGSVERAILGYYKERKYEWIDLEGPLEIASCTGNVSLDEKGEVTIHSHVVVSDKEGKAYGGHLTKGCSVGATAELVIIEALGIELRRTLDEKTSLRLWDFG